ncbi:MAG TPA: hypothetical protein VG826_10395 [Pirellulales bacterium]|nr:hypothetical protein [Pirellulales bacterium]
MSTTTTDGSICATSSVDDTGAGDEGGKVEPVELAAANPAALGGVGGIGGLGGAMPAAPLGAGTIGRGVGANAGLGDGPPGTVAFGGAAAGALGVNAPDSVVPSLFCPTVSTSCLASSEADGDDERRNATKRPIGKQTVVMTKAPANSSLVSKTGAGFFSSRGFGRRKGFVPAAGTKKTCLQ